MSKILAQGMITLTQLYEGAQVILTPPAVLIPCDSKENPKPNAYINASTNVKAFLGTMDITSGITLGELEYSDSTVKASKTETKVSITAITTRTGYVDIPVSATINGETIDLGKHRFNFVKQIDGQPGIPGDPGFGYTLNIKGGTRGVAYAANGTNPEPNTSSQFSVELLKNGVKVANPASISWTCGGNLSGASSVATFTPTIKSTYASGSSYVKVSVKEFAASLAVEETIPIICTKHADGLDWINEWNDKYVQVGTEKIITPKIFAGTKSSANELTGVAIGRDVLGGNTNKVIGIVGYKKNTPVFSLDQDANFFVSSSGNAGDIKNGTNNAKGLYFDGNNLYISGKVKISGGSTIGESNTLVDDVINNSNLGAQANNKLDNLSIGGRNLAQGTSETFKTLTGFTGITNHCGLNHKVLLKGLSVGDSITTSFVFMCENLTNNNPNRYVRIQGSGDVTGWGNGLYQHYDVPIDYSKPTQQLNIIHTFTITENHLKNEYWTIGLRLDYITGGTVGIKELMVEKGNKKSTWTPSPEDVDAEISAVNNKAQDSINKLTELASDSKLTASEKLVVKREWDVIVGEKTKITSEADKFGVSKTDYESKYNTLNSYITPLLSNLTTTSDINGSTFRSNFTNYYNSRQDLLNAITTKAKTLADNAQSTANTANNTANTVNTTVNNNKNNWSNAYNRVAEWAQGAVTGSVDIDGGKIAANTIIAEKIAVGDFNNYATVSELNPATMLPSSHFGGTKIVSTNSTTTEIAKTNSSNDYLMLSGYIPTPFVVNDELLISFRAYNCLSEDKAVTFAVWYYDANKKYLKDNSVAITLTGKTWKQYEVSLKLTSIDTNVRYVAIGFRDSNGTDLRIRNPRVVRKSMGKMIVDGTIEARHIKSDVLSASTIVSTINNGTTTISGGKITSGTITTDHIHTNGLNANVIKAGTISADRLDANTIVSKVNGGTTEINGNRIQTGTLSASKITTGTLDANKVNVTNIKAGNIVSGTIDASKISVTNLNASNITSGTLRGGGYNLLRNSGFKNEKNYWYEQKHNNPTGGIFELISSSATWGYPDASVKTAQIRLSNQSSIEYGIAQNFNTTIGKQYTLTFQYAGHRVGGANVIIRGANSSWLANKYFTPTSFNGGNGNVNQWGTCSLTFTATTTSHTLNIVINTAQDNGYLWVAKPQIVEGAMTLPYSPHPNEIYDGSTVIDADGVTINNGALKVKNKSGSTVLSGDVNGNLIFSGTAKSQSGDRWVSLDAGGVSFQDSNKQEQLMRIGISSMPDNRDMNGVTFAMPQYSDYTRFSHIAKPDLTSGWTTSDTQYTFFDLWSSAQTVGSNSYQKGIITYAPLYARGATTFNNRVMANNGLKLKSASAEHPAEISGTMTWSPTGGSVSSLLGLYGDNGSILGYKNGSSYGARIIATEGAHPGTGDQIISWGNWNLNTYTLHNGHFNGRSLTVSGSKNCVQETENYGKRLINAYETAEYYFGDLGFGTINKNGECYVDIDDIFAECVNTKAKYHVFTQAYNGSIESIERYTTYFIVKGKPGTEFSWELKAKRIGYENNRLDAPEENIDYRETGLQLFSDDDFSVNTSEKSLLEEIDFNLENLLMEE